jgi:hypothetical protein
MCDDTKHRERSRSSRRPQVNGSEGVLPAGGGQAGNAATHPQGGGLVEHVVLQPRLVIRSSTGPAR